MQRSMIILKLDANGTPVAPIVNLDKSNVWPSCFVILHGLD